MTSAAQWAAQAMSLAQRRLEIAADNLANLSTNGFRRRAVEVTRFAERLRLASRTVEAQGAIRPTGGAFDLALAGRGNFTLRASDGAIVRGRDGAFSRTDDGRLVDARGRALMGRHGVLHVSPGARIDADGSVREGERVVDALDLPPGTTVRQGALEVSGVEATRELLSILSAERAFESGQRIVTTDDAARRKAIDDVARVR
ncbi:MAG TPA: flagellar basal body rod C-terminal domain-containing protein [Candidatus Dormibacteraeota bacterium]|nr:flagellar basal body rod C-terminal domain-containing protein [Candidatus Dormibacteraeota bacterium]